MQEWESEQRFSCFADESAISKAAIHGYASIPITLRSLVLL
jgi:hypothetical protein